jgi:predicted 3-demethylubiquinone-9 3-methyltransferase (glyoxalase superfamily)
LDLVAPRPGLRYLSPNAEEHMQRITPFLWFDGQAEAAVDLYVSVFRDSRIKGVSRYPEGAPGPAGTVMSITFELEKQEFIALNGGPQFRFTPALSLFVNCETQEEVDELWERLSAGGEKGQCGWLTDRFGVSWQIVPTVLGKLLSSRDAAKAKRVTQAMLKMHKLEIEKLLNA